MSGATTRRQFLRCAGGAFISLLCGRNGFGAEERARPNVVFIFIDDMGYGDLSCFGNTKLRTTHIDRLAAEGLKLTQFYVNAPICSPSRVAVTTGQYPARWRIHSYLNSREANRKRDMADFLDPKAPSLARVLKEAGYATGHFGKWHMGGGRDVDDAPHPKAYGFDESVVSFEGLGDRILHEGSGLSEQSAKLGQGRVLWMPKHKISETYVDRAIDFIRRNEDRPFYINLWPNDIHDAHRPKTGAAERFKDVTDNPYEQKMLAVLEELDRQIGRLVAELERLGLDERTLVILTSDNGPTDWPSYYKSGGQPPGSSGPFRGRKWSLYEGGIRMPFIARWKGKIPAGRTNSESVVCGIDLFPSICRLAGADVPSDVSLDGQDMSEALLGQEVERTGPIFWEYSRVPGLKPGNPQFHSPKLAIRQGCWKLLTNDDGGDTQLYDLSQDIAETNNLFEKQPDIGKQLRDKLLQWRRSLP